MLNRNRFPHVYTGRIDAFPLPADQLRYGNTHLASPSSALCQTTAARRSPDCTPPSEICPSCLGRSHRRPSAATAVAAAWHPTAPGIADSIARTALSARPIRRATCRAEALSHAWPTASSKRLLKGALLGSSGTFSILTPHTGHLTRYTSMCTVAWNTLHGRSRTARSRLS